MHLFVGKSVVILPVGMLVERARRIELEAVDALVHKIGQVVEPVLLARLRATLHARCDNILFDNALVVVDAEPLQAQLYKPPVQAADEAGFPFVLPGTAPGNPVAFRREEFVIPSSFGRSRNISTSTAVRSTSRHARHATSVRKPAPRRPSSRTGSSCI